MGNSSCCRGNRAASTNDGSVLDRVISQASNQDECLLYRLANYKNGGELIDAYNVGGQSEVEKLIKEQFGVLMYADGRGQVINRAEYLRWKFRDQEKVVLPIEASLSPHDPLAKWTDHEACWQMQYRGSLGETLLHVLIICDTKIHTRLARTLLKCFPKQALDVVEGEDYLGASALHLAIAYNNNELVQDLVEAGANVAQRAIGSFFLPRDQQRPRPSKHTDYEGLAYLGEFPLAWAACCANESVYNLLLDSGADPDSQDTFGNMILHMVVVCDKLDMFGYALRHPKVPARNGIVNRSGLTPLTLACKLGRAEVFREMLELSAREFWRYSNITCSAYPLNALDTLLPDGRTNWNSALFIILNGTKEEHLDMLDGGIIQRLLEEKWKTFARLQFLKRLAILALHLLLLSMAIYLRPTDRDEPLLGGTDWNDIVRYSSEIGTIMGVLSYVIFQQGEEIKNQGFWSFMKQLSHAPDKAIFLISNLLLLACIPFRLMGDIKTEEAILVFAVPGSWFLLMFFAGAIRLTGPFVTMVYSMITGDMLTFGIIYTVVLFGFSQSFYFLYKGFPGVKTSLYHSYPSTWMALFQITLGDYNYAELSLTTYPTMTKTVFAIFMVFVPILLLNMLIAMMGNTYAHVIEQSEKEWMKQWAKIVVSLERAVNQSDAHHYLQEYSISLGPSDDPSTEQRGVMVIKSKSKTRAKQRKGAVMNWKRVGKVTINELRKRGMTGEQLRRLMWERASISTPVRVPVSPDLLGESEPAAAGFGDALTAALDVMAFTHDLDLNTGPQLAGPPLPSAPTPAVTVPTSIPVPSAPPLITSASLARPVRETGGAERMNDLFSQLGPEIGPGLYPKLPSADVVDDPFRQLVMASELPNMDVELAALANAAAKLDGAEEVSPREQHRYCCSKTIQELGNEHTQPTANLDPSDSDGLGDGPLLGRGSQLRRARFRSANSSKTAVERRQLFQHYGDSSSTTSSDIGIVNPAFVKEFSPPERSNGRRESVQSRGFAVKSPDMRDDADVSKTSIRPRPRPKTARTNRVAPVAEKPARRGGSAVPAASHPQESEGSAAESTSPPDPLDAWSTRNIANMNTLLAWDKEEEESL
ncbi:transient receptor potential cation channel subfamily V member 4 [Anabrus simplex]|uniref:transient receptor potential cation channel subfamily V member 4 n=1 Tax=Anabrus simplex TaxID=316456 RepID=UPI0035A2D049